MANAVHSGEKEAVNEEPSKKLQAQTKIIKIKAENKHNKILNSNNLKRRKGDITQILHYLLAHSLSARGKKS